MDIKIRSYDLKNSHLTGYEQKDDEAAQRYELKELGQPDGECDRLRARGL